MNSKLSIDTPNDTSAKRQVSQCSYAKRDRKHTLNDTWKLRQTKQSKEIQLLGIVQEFSAVLCTNLPMYRCVL